MMPLEFGAYPSLAESCVALAVAVRIWVVDREQRRIDSDASDWVDD